MVSPAKPPDPMTCALATLLLPESRSVCCLLQETLFPEPVCVHPGACVPRPCLHAGCARAACVSGGSRGSGVGAGGGCLATQVGGIQVGRVLLAARRACGVSVRVGVWRAGRRCVFPWCGVGHACALGLVRRPVALSGLLLRWSSGAFNCVGRGWVAETFLAFFTRIRGTHCLSPEQKLCQL